MAEGKRHLIGRRITGYQSNEELTGRHAQACLTFGRLFAHEELERRVNGVSLQQVRSLVPAFLDGPTVLIDTAWRVTDEKAP